MTYDEIEQLLHDTREDFLQYADCDEECLIRFVEQVLMNAPED